jgi:hypothetical protein
MRRFNPFSALAVVLLTAGAVCGELPAQGVSEGRAEPESLAGWEWYQEVSLPSGAQPPRLADFLVPPAVLGRAREDLADLRLYDAEGRPVDYALRVLASRDEQHPLNARQFNPVTHEDRSVEVSLDLGDNPAEHNELAVTTGGSDVRRRLRLEGGDDGKRWAVILDRVYLVHFQVGPQLVDVHSFRYPPSRFRYLRLRVFPDTSLERDQPALTGMLVSHTIHVTGVDVTQNANLNRREPVPADGGPGSAWLIDLGDRVPCARLELDVADETFQRPFRLEQADPGEPVQVLVRGEWHRRPGEERGPLKVKLPREVMARRLRLVVTDYRNPPLTLTAARYSAPARQVVFAPAGLAGPLRLYFGNPRAQAPHYDFAANLPVNLDPSPARVPLGALEANPAYQPPLRPWTERHPYLVDVVLGLASLVLLGILAVLGREAIRRHDAAQTVPAAPAP